MSKYSEIQNQQKIPRNQINTFYKWNKESNKFKYIDYSSASEIVKDTQLQEHAAAVFIFRYVHKCWPCFIIGGVANDGHVSQHICCLKSSSNKRYVPYETLGFYIIMLLRDSFQVFQLLHNRENHFIFIGNTCSCKFSDTTPREIAYPRNGCRLFALSTPVEWCSRVENNDNII